MLTPERQTEEAEDVEAAPAAADAAWPKKLPAQIAAVRDLRCIRDVQHFACF